MRSILLACLVSLVAAPAASAARPRLSVQREPLYERGGILLVHFRCDRALECFGRIGVGRARRPFDLAADEGGYVRLHAHGSRRTARIVVRERGRTRTLVRRVRHRADPITCGYGGRARTIAGGGDARILLGDLDRGDFEPSGDELVLCRRGTAFPIADEIRTVGDETGVAAATVTDRWAVVATTSENRYGDRYQAVWLVAVDGPHERHHAAFAADPIVTDPPPPANRLWVATDGAVVVGALEDGRCSLRALDGAGERIVTTGADRQSVRIDGQVLSWTRGPGTPRESATVAGLPR